MDARTKTISEIFYSGEQYRIPFFQRNYSWGKKNWQQLLDDVENLSEESNSHFLGPLVCSPLPPRPGETTSYQVIDGQQRLTTIALMLLAIRKVAKDLESDGLAEEILEDFIVHKRREGLSRYKLVPRVDEREAWFFLIDSNSKKSGPDFNILKAWDFYCKKIAKVAGGSVEALRNLFDSITKKLALVVITIDNENAFEIFESLNSTGLPLEQSDLIRNFVFMSTPLDEQETFHREAWSRFEGLFGSLNGHEEIDQTTFYRNYLMKGGKYTKKREVYADFKSRFQSRDDTPREWITELTEYANIELCFSRPESVEDQETQSLLNDIKSLATNTPHPLMMALFAKHQKSEISSIDLNSCLRDLVSFIVRRSVCGESSRNYDKWFTEAIQYLGSSPNSSLKDFLTAKGWPPDSVFVPQLVSYNAYKKDRRKTRRILERLENAFGHKERVNLDRLTIEHVMPQTIPQDDASEGSWLRMLGDDWFTTHQAWLHTIGNLTFSGYNSDLSNHKFKKKLELLSTSNVSLTKEIRGVTSWTSDVIKSRGERLATQIAKIWPAPISQTAPIKPVPQPDSFDVEALRQAAIKRIELITGQSFSKLSTAKYRETSTDTETYFLASKPYDGPENPGYWFGFNPSQLEQMEDSRCETVALCCGSPDQLLLFKYKDWKLLTENMTVTFEEGTSSIRHWHVAIQRKSDRFLLSQPKINETVDVTEHLFGS